MVDQFTPTDWAKAGKWDGTPVEGSRFTVQQLAELERRGIPALSVEVRRVKLRRPRERTLADIACHRPIEECVTETYVDCPILFSGPEGQRVITPGGDVHTFGQGARPREGKLL